MSTPHNDRAARLRELHRPGDPLLLPNVWDAASAAAVAGTGFPALATASAAIAAMLGVPDHEGGAADDMLAAAERVVRAVDLPVSVDAESGYGLDPADLHERLTRIGAVGCNIEDTDHRGGGLTDATVQAARIAGLRAAADETGLDLVVNARVDTFLPGNGLDEEQRVVQALERGKRYLDAGADCVFAILATSEDSLSRLVDGLSGRVSAICVPGGPGLARFAELGVARVSFGPVAYLAAIETVKTVAEAVAAHRDPYAEVRLPSLAQPKADGA